MMTLSRRSRLVRWAYFFGTVPSRTSLCAIFWRTLAMTCLAMLGAFWVGALCYAAWLQPAVPIAVIGVIGFAVLARYLWPRTAAKLSAPIRSSPLYQGAKAVKSKVCPLVEIKRR